MRINRKKAKSLAALFGVFGVLAFLGKFLGFLPSSFANSFGLSCFILCAVILLGMWILLKRGDKR